jgi:2-keto-4-pentenoate hydratase
MNVSEAADCIWEGYRRGEYFPPELVGMLSFDEALRVQLDILERRLARGERLAGWKIGLTSATVRAHFGTDRQPFGHIIESGVIPSPGEVALDDLAVGCGVEPELCVTMGSDLRGPGVTASDARAAVASIAPGMEINQKRCGGVTDFELSVADNLTQWAIVQGPPSPVTDAFDSDSLRVTMSCNGTVRADVVGRDVIDDHFVSVATLANVLGEYGRHLEAGQRLITGSFSKHDVSRGDEWRAEFAGLGACSVRFR